MNTMIAKLLAKENIHVQHGNYRTAFFDVEKRVLGLPKWKDMGKDVYDLLVGHEVGHALYTPTDGWHDSEKEIPGIPRSYLNIVEDIRIEKMIQRTYPGLTGSFKRGYKALNDQDFFGIIENDIDVNTSGLMDRINLKSKLRDLIDVEFSEAEKDVVAQAFAVETWEDVLAACKALYEFNEENKDDEQEQGDSVDISDASQDDESDVSADDQSSSDDGETSDEDGTSSAGGQGDSDENEPSGEEDSSKSANDQPENDGTSNEDAEVNKPSDGAGADESMDIDPHASKTDEAFRNKEEELLDTDNFGRQKKIVYAINRKQLDDMLVTYPEIAEKRAGYNSISDVDKFNDEYRVFNDETKKFVGVMAKEFEMRKMAYRYNRSQTSRSGSLDMNKLHAYKVTDDIFNRVTTLADAKSHGMVMFIDFSGSMGGIIGDVVKQTLILAQFCKKVSIPFDVYSFTTGHHTDTELEESQVDHNRTAIVHLLSSSMKKPVFEQASREMFMMAARSTYCTVYDNLGGTPLNETIMASRFILADFQKKYGVQKVNAIFMTDGDAQGMHYKASWDDENQMPTSGMTVEMDGKYYDSASRWEAGRDVTAKLLNSLRDKYTVIGYFLAERAYDFRGKIWASHDSYVADETMKAYRKEYNKNKFIVFPNVLGYDEFFIIKAEGDTLKPEAEEFTVSEDAKKGEIARAFKKHANSKKTNKLFATQFAKMVA